MQLRIKNTNIWVEFLHYADIDQDIAVVEFKNGDISHIHMQDLTDITCKEAFQNFIFSVFSKNGSVKNQIIFIGSAILLGFIIGGLIL